MSANSGDLDQTPRNVESDLGPHCLLMSIKRTLGLKGSNPLHENTFYHLVSTHSSYFSNNTPFGANLHINFYRSNFWITYLQ